MKILIASATALALVLSWQVTAAEHGGGHHDGGRAENFEHRGGHDGGRFDRGERREHSEHRRHRIWRGNVYGWYDCDWPYSWGDWCEAYDDLEYEELK